MEALSAWAERRPITTERQRAEQAAYYAQHLPRTGTVFVGDDDLYAMRAAFIRRFNEDLPRTETLMAVAMIGYRMALRDAQTIETGTAKTKGLGAKPESVVGATDAPKGG